jgi:Zinc carboxypeptidase/Chitobiase/beta-hexosaminidase C-terminal domain
MRGKFKAGPLVLLAALVFGLLAVTGAGASGVEAHEGSSVVEVILADVDELDRLLAEGFDLDHQVKYTQQGIVVNAVVTPTEQAELEQLGFTVGATLFSAEQLDEVLAERNAVRAAKLRGAGMQSYLATGVEQTENPNLRVLRADWFTSTGTPQLNVEALHVDGSDPSVTIQLEWDTGPGTPMGSGGSISMQRFVDAGVYMYHRRQTSSPVQPDMIRLTSSTGDVVDAKVTEWLPPDPLPDKDRYEDFVDNYMDPTELYAKINALASEFPDLAEIRNLPYTTNGYRRQAQAIVGSTSGSANQAAAFYVTSNAYGSEGGNDLMIETVDPGAPNSPLSVALMGNLVRVNLATDAGGALVSTANDVAAAINASGAPMTAATYRTASGNGIVQATAAPIALSDFLEAPPSVSRDPFQVQALVIGKTRDGSKPGVLAYAQEHAREWVPPLVTVETAERLLRNYARDGRVKQLLRNLEIWIIPSINPDGGHYSFYDDNGQRKNMFNYCPPQDADPNRRDDWGVDVNRNYAIGSLFDGYSGASTNCRSETFSGPSELSEPESRNLIWVADNHPNIRFSMNLHSSGNYFMWAPGAYIVPGRITLPRPDPAEEAYFYLSAERILTAIKDYRGLSVTPARTGPVADVLYSAAGNSGDHLWYANHIFAWDFEVGTSFQPNWTEAHAETMEFSNGLEEMMRVAYDWSRDNKPPKSRLLPGEGTYSGPQEMNFVTPSEPAIIYYTLDGSRPDYSSLRLVSQGARQGAAPITISATTTVKWFSVDMAGNVEQKYDPSNPSSNNYHSERIVITP